LEKTSIGANAPSPDFFSSKDWKRLLPGLAISLISLAVVFYLAEPLRLADALRLADFRLVLAAVGLSLSWSAMRALVWRTLLQNQAGYVDVFFTVNEGYLLNNILPFRLGELGRALLLSKKTELSFWEVFPTIIIERVLDLAMAAGLLLSTLPFVVGAAWAGQAAMIAGLIVLAGLALLYILARRRDWALEKFNLLGARWPVLIRLGKNRLESFLDGLSILTDASFFFRSVILVLFNWLIAILQYYVLMLAFFPQAHFLAAAFSLAIVALGIAAPSSPGAVGVLELSLVGALSVFGYDRTVALAFALTVHLMGYLLTGILGTIGLAQDGESLMGLYLQLRSGLPKSG